MKINKSDDEFKSPEEQYKDLITFINKNSFSDPILVLYKIRQSAYNPALKDYRDDLSEQENKLIKWILINPTIDKTELPTPNIIDELKQHTVDEAFWIFYRQLQNQNDVSDYAADFQYFFDMIRESRMIFVVLIYNLLNLKQVDYVYTHKGVEINPAKCQSLENNKRIEELQKELYEKYIKSPQEADVAKTVFSSYLYDNWVNFALDKEVPDIKIVFEVTENLLGQKETELLSEEAKKLLDSVNKSR